MMFKQHTYLVFILLAGLTLLSGCAALMPASTADYTDPVSGMKFVHVPAGSFQMGPSDDGRERELPVHTVTLEAFSVGMYEVTYNQYKQFYEATSRKKPMGEELNPGNWPIINVSWEDAIEYTEWLSKKTGQNFSLPSESEWEYFARAGTTTPYWTGDTLPNGTANCNDCGNQENNKQSVPVGSFRPNPWGIYDTAGNVTEWTLDTYYSGYEGAPDDGKARIDTGTNDKVTRGGSWESSKQDLKSSTRDWAERDARYGNIGFRLVLHGIAPGPEKRKK